MNVTPIRVPKTLKSQTHRMSPIAIRCCSPMWTLPVVKYPSSISEPPNAFVPYGSFGNQAAWAIDPLNRPRNARTTDQPIQ